jgi:hypothetical protein
MKHTFHNILLNFLYLATLCTFFIIALISSVTLPSAEGRICNTLSKNSVECQ